jgi:hypothetical protein
MPTSLIDCIVRSFMFYRELLRKFSRLGIRGAISVSGDARTGCKDTETGEILHKGL